MIDTLMVVWTSGMWKHLLRNIGAFVLLFVGICALLFLITASGKQWPGLAVSVAHTNTSTQADSTISSAPADLTVTAQPVPSAYSTAQPFIQPIIPQNPVQPDAHHQQNMHKHINRHASAPTYNPPSQQPGSPNPPANSNPYDPTNMLPNLP